MSEEGQTINPQDYSINILTPPLEGSESRLYKGTDKNGKIIALKIYPNRPTVPEITTENLLDYQKITNNLAEKYNQSERFINLEIDGKIVKLKLFIVPIDSVGISYERPNDPNSKCPSTISEFIDGPTLFDLEPNYISRRFNSLQQDPLVQLGKNLREEAKLDTISIIPWNVKVLLDKNPPTLAITDITGSIANL